MLSTKPVREDVRMTSSIVHNTQFKCICNANFVKQVLKLQVHNNSTHFLYSLCRKMFCLYHTHKLKTLGDAPCVQTATHINHITKLA